MLTTKLDALLGDLARGDETAKIKALQWLAHEMDPADAPRVVAQIRQLTVDASPAIRYHARLALDEIARRGGMPHEAPAKEEQEILDLLAHEAAEVRLRGVLSAYETRSSRLLDALTRLLRIEADPWVRASLVKAVAGYKRRISLPLLMKYLEDPDGRVRANTVEALAELENPVVTSKILELIDDPEHRVQSAVLTALGRGRPGDIRPKIESMLASDLVWLQASAVYVIQETMPDWALDVLLAFADKGIRDRRLRGRVANLIEVLARRRASGEPPPERKPLSVVEFEDDESTLPTSGGSRRDGKLRTDH